MTMTCLIHRNYRRQSLSCENIVSMNYSWVRVHCEVCRYMFVEQNFVKYQKELWMTSRTELSCHVRE